MDFKYQLAKQLRFIETSCAAFDNGGEDEAARIALAIRVIMHDTKRSTSILTHLGAKTSVKLMAYSGEFEDKPGLIQADLLTLFGSSGVTAACFGPPSTRRYVPAEIWWNEIVFARGEVRVTRENLVRYTADKDGGAHVDASLHDDHVMLQSFWTQMESGEPDRLIDVARLGLRTLAFEILNSPDLSELAGTAPATT